MATHKTAIMTLKKLPRLNSVRLDKVLYGECVHNVFAGLHVQMLSVGVVRMHLTQSQLSICAIQV